MTGSGQEIKKRIGIKRIAAAMIFLLAVTAAYALGCGSGKDNDDTETAEENEVIWIEDEIEVAGTEEEVPDTGEKVAEKKYEYEADQFKGTITITKYLGDESIVFVPEELDGKTVGEIGYGAFSGNADIEQVILPSTVKKIGGDAFSHCTNLQYVFMGQEVESIGGEAFAYCLSMKEIRFPQELKDMGVNMCAYCTQLETLVFPGQTNCTQGGDSFIGCISLKTIYGRRGAWRAEYDAVEKGSVYIDLDRIEEEGNQVW